MKVCSAENSCLGRCMYPMIARRPQDHFSTPKFDPRYPAWLRLRGFGAMLVPKIDLTPARDPNQEVLEKHMYFLNICSIFYLSAHPEITYNRPGTSELLHFAANRQQVPSGLEGFRPRASQGKSR